MRARAGSVRRRPPGSPGDRLRQIVAQFQQADDLLLRERAVQEEGDPVGLVHVVGGQDARSAEEGAGQERATFYIENVDRLRPFQPQPGSGNLQKGRKPLGAAAVAQDGIAGEFGPEVLPDVPGRIAECVPSVWTVGSWRSLLTDPLLSSAPAPAFWRPDGPPARAGGEPGWETGGGPVRRAAQAGR